MAISLRNTYSAYATSVGSVAVTIGDLIVVFGSTNTGTQTIADNAAGGTNTYSLAEDVGPLAVAALGRCWYAVAKATETLTITLTSGADPGISVHVVIGNWTLATALHLSDQDADTGTTNTHVTPSLITTVADAYLFSAFFQEEASSTQTSNDSFTKRTEHSTHCHTTLDRIVSATGTYSGSVGSGAAVNFGCVIAAFVEVVGVSAALTGTGGDGMTEAQVVAGGETIIVTLTGETFITS